MLTEEELAGYGITPHDYVSSLGYLPGNIVPCCGPCNTRKGTKEVGEFLRES